MRKLLVIACIAAVLLTVVIAVPVTAAILSPDATAAASRIAAPPVVAFLAYIPETPLRAPPL